MHPFICLGFIAGLLQATVTKQSVYCRLLSTEVDVELHRVVAVAHFEHIGAECVGCCLVEDAFLSKQVEAIGVEHFGLQIGVVARSVVVTAENVLEVWAAVAVFNFSGFAKFLRY